MAVHNLWLKFKGHFSFSVSKETIEGWISQIEDFTLTNFFNLSSQEVIAKSDVMFKLLQEARTIRSTLPRTHEWFERVDILCSAASVGLLEFNQEIMNNIYLDGFTTSFEEALKKVVPDDVDAYMEVYNNGGTLFMPMDLMIESLNYKY